MNTKIKNKLHKELIIILDEFDRVCKSNNLKYFLIGGTLLGSVRHNGFIPWDDDIDVAMPREDYEKLISISEDVLGERFFLDHESTNNNYWSPFAKIKLKNTAYVESNVKKNTDNCCMWIDIFPLDYTKNNEQSKLEERKNKIKRVYSILYNKNAKSLKDFDTFYKKIGYLLLFLIPNKLLFNYRNKIMQEENGDDCKFYINFGSQYSVKKQTHEIAKVLPLRQRVFEKKEYSVPNDCDYVLSNIYGKTFMELPPKEKRITHNPYFIKFSDGEEVRFDEEI